MIDALLVILILTNLVLLGTSLFNSCIRTVALQGVILGLLALLAVTGQGWSRALILGLGAIVIKGAVIPWLLTRTLREANVRREVEPYVGYSASMLAGVLALAFSFWLGARLPLSESQGGSLALPTALFTMLTGLFVIISRRKALTQVLGYLVLENGIYAIGLVLVGEVQFLVELGVLLDVLVAVFVMGIAIYHISREFEHMDVDQLDRLKG